MANLSSHKSTAAPASIEATGAPLMLLPPYSPDLNLIECMWSKARASLRRESQRAKKTLINAIGRALQSIAPNDCKSFFQSVGINAL